MRAPTLSTLLAKFSAAADVDPARAVRMWSEISGHPDWPGSATRVRLSALNDLAAAYSGSGDHERAIAAAEDALAATPPDDPDHPYRQSCLAERIAARYAATGHEPDLTRLVAVRRAAVDSTAGEDPDLVVRLSALADAYRTRWWATEDATALTTAVQALETAEATAGSFGADPARTAGNLAVVLADRFEATGDDADLDAALDAVARARDASPAGHPDRGTHLLLHATLLSDRYDHGGRLADLHDAIAIAYATLDEPLDDDRELARLQNLLGLLELDGNQVEGNARRLDVAVNWARAATATTDAADPELAGYLTNLGAAHRLAFEATLAEIDWSTPEDVEADVTGLRAALDGPPQAPDQPRGRTPRRRPGLARRGRARRGDRSARRGSRYDG